MTRKIIPPSRTVPGTKDVNGAYLPPEASSQPLEEVSIKRSNLSLDDMLNSQLLAIERATQQLTKKAAEGLNKDDIQSLATLTKLTMELKAKEKALLEGLTEEELKTLLGDDQ